MLRTACAAALLLLLAGCAQGGSHHDASVDTTPPKLGSCRALTPHDVAGSTDDSAVVDCRKPHTAQTFAVGSFPSSVASKGTGSRALGAYVYARCQKGFERFVGADDSLLLRTTLTWAWFRPSRAAWDKGAHTWRCDVVGDDRAGTTLLPLPATSRGLLLRRPDDRWLVCVDGPTVTGSPRVPCDRPHTWRAVTTIVLGKPGDPYPGDRLAEVRTRDFCSDSVGAWLNYPVDYDFGYTWYHQAEWQTGNRRSICWAKTDQ